MGESAWKALDTAPRKGEDGKPVPVLLFAPSAWHTTDEQRRPTAIAHARVVGWWDEAQQSWVMGIHPNSPLVQKVYPSLWADLVAEPEFPG